MALLAMPSLLALLCFAYFWFGLFDLRRLRLARPIAELASLARTKLELAWRLFRKHSLPDLGVGCAHLPPNFDGEPHRSPP